MGRTLDALERAFVPLLASYGFHEIARQESSGFGNGLILYQSGAVRLRLLSDRDHPSVEFSRIAEPDNWYDMERFVQGLPAVPTPDDLALAFTNGYTQIKEELNRFSRDV